MRSSLVWIVSLALPIAAGVGAGCSTDVRDNGLTSASATATTTGPDGTSGAMTTMDAESSSSADTTGDPTCSGELIDPPPTPNGWEGPVLAYGFEGNVASAPDCGGGTPAEQVALINGDSTTCACECAAPPHNLCAVTMFGACEGGAPLGAYGGDCHTFDEPVAQFQATSTPLGSCVSAPVASTPPVTPALWGCEIPDDGCSDAPASGRVCVYAEGLASECPGGFENGPVMAARAACEGDCDNCMTPDYCANTLGLELHSTADCSSPATQTISPLECPGGLFAAVRAVPEPLTCIPAVELTRTPVVVSVCCAP